MILLNLFERPPPPHPKRFCHFVFKFLRTFLFLFRDWISQSSPPIFCNEGFRVLLTAASLTLNRHYTPPSKAELPHPISAYKCHFEQTVSFSLFFVTFTVQLTLVPANYEITLKTHI